MPDAHALPSPTDRAVLAIDLGSPTASVALARDGTLLAAEAWARAGPDDEPLARVAAVLNRAGLDVAAIGGVIALRGPGSFTGTRVACATAIALAAAARSPSTGVSTLEALALSAPSASGTLVAAVDALRGEWFVQRFRRGTGTEVEPLEPPRLLAAHDLRELAGALPVYGYGGATGEPGDALAGGLAPVVALAAAGGRWAWDAALLSRPLYLRPPAATPTPPRRHGT